MNAPASPGDSRPAAAPPRTDARLEEDARRPAQDWEGLLTSICDRLREIQSSPAVARDPVVRAIFDDMARAADIEELSADIDRLAARVAVVLANPRRAGAASRASAAAHPARIKLRL